MVSRLSSTQCFYYYLLFVGVVESPVQHLTSQTQYLSSCLSLLLPLHLVSLLPWLLVVGPLFYYPLSHSLTHSVVVVLLYKSGL